MDVNSNVEQMLLALRAAIGLPINSVSSGKYEAIVVPVWPLAFAVMERMLSIGFRVAPAVINIFVMLIMKRIM